MAWTTPRTWTNPELITDVIMNAHIRDNLSYLKSAPTFDSNVIISGTTQLTGKVGIGAANDPNISLYVKHYDTGSSSTFPLYVKDSSGNSLFGVRSDGHTSVNVAPDPNILFYIKHYNSSSGWPIYIQNSTPTLLFNVDNAGNGYLKASAWTYGSDARMKENIATLEYGLDQVLQLKPRRFDYIEGAKQQIGFIAQELQPIFPEMVIEQDDGMLSVRDNITPVLVNAIQELSSTITKQKEHIQQLETRIAILEEK